MGAKPARNDGFVNIQPMMSFDPRRLHPEKPIFKFDGPPPPDHHDELKHENPWIPRATDFVHVTSEFVEHTVPHAHEALHAPMQVAHAASAAGAAIWGVNKLLKGQTALDRIDAATSLSLAAESALSAAGGALPAVGLTFALLHASGELILGQADLRRGMEENSTRRGAAGACQLLTGVGTGIAHLVPGGEILGHSLMMVGMLGRQAAISTPEQ
jgi:hypothetical protein